MSKEEIKIACDAYCKVCGHYYHTVPTHICRQDCDYYLKFYNELNKTNKDKGRPNDDQPKTNLSREEESTHTDMTWEDMADGLLEEFEPAQLEQELNAIKQIRPGLYVRPDEVKANLIEMLKTGEDFCVKVGADWYEDTDKCLYIRMHRTKLGDGTVNRDITLMLTIGGVFCTF